jgi:hypothetical protein
VITLIIQMQEASSSCCTQRQYVEQLMCTALHHVTGNEREGGNRLRARRERRGQPTHHRRLTRQSHWSSVGGSETEELHGSMPGPHNDGAVQKYHSCCSLGMENRRWFHHRLLHVVQRRAGMGSGEQSRGEQEMESDMAVPPVHPRRGTGGDFTLAFFIVGS